MKIIRIIMLLGLLPLLASCSSDGLGFDSAEQAGAGQVTFRFACRQMSLPGCAPAANSRNR